MCLQTRPNGAGCCSANAWRIEAGRTAIGALRPRQLIHIAGRYRVHYGPSLFGAGDPQSWIRAGLYRLRAPRDKHEAASAALRSRSRMMVAPSLRLVTQI
jgi:hypothetical protein